ncbi:MAG: NADH-quinone oxidoreductase subunit M [Planctomycetota bacterium]
MIGTTNDHVLTLLVLAPAIGAALLPLLPRSAARSVTLGVMTLVALVAWSLAVGGDAVRVAAGEAGVARLVATPWVPSLGVDFLLGVDGLSLPLVLLTATLAPLALVASGAITTRVRLYCALLLLLECGVLGVFLALDLVLFYVFWELILLPMYLLIAVWGGPDRRAAAVKYVVYTLVGSVLLLGGVLLLYGASDLTRLGAEELARAGVLDRRGFGDVKTAEPDDRSAAADRALSRWLDGDTAAARRFVVAEATATPAPTFNLLALRALAERGELGGAAAWGGRPLAWWAFVLMTLGLAIKLPAVPLHTWLPAAHVEAPTGVSMLLAGVLLKLGGYGLVRVAWPLCPAAAADLAPVVGAVGVVGLVWGALAALAQTDFKRLVAYSSVSHMGYVLLGLAVGSLAGEAGRTWSLDEWTLGATGAVFQMVAHGVTSAGMFFAVGVVYDRVHHRDLPRLGGLMNRMPMAAGLGLVIALASLGLPGLCGFVGEVLVLLPAWEFSPPLATSAAATTVLTAAYVLRAVSQAYYGAEYRGPNADRLTPLSGGELLVGATLAGFSVVLGVAPWLVTDRVEPVVAGQGAAMTRSAQAAESVALLKPPRTGAPHPAADHAALAR